jgi:hypothetical protein
MRRADRVILIAALLPLALVLGGCETSSLWDKANSVSDRFQDMLGDFNPFGTAKKPLPGDRRPLFPEGVPGVQQGVPPELMRGNPQDAQAQPPTEPQPPATKAKSKQTKKTQARAPVPAEQKTTDPAEDAVWPPPPTR